MAAGLWGAVFVASGVASPPTAVPAEPSAVEAPADAPQQAAGTPPAGYVGADTCATCHEGYDKNVAGTKHGFKANPGTPAAQQGCESCHGPGEAHVNDPEKIKPILLAKVSASQSNQQCQTCHSRGEHALWEGSQHENRNVKCIDCHSIHSAKGPVLMQAKTEQ
ncbi:MAG: multiheme c-type cytochrome, partial [Acidobacteriota bacterium]|nr:multiheme c-type cytochrome [Acidobacteriota bacterium]